MLGALPCGVKVANFVHHYKSGHYYFTLQDERASVKAVMFRQDAQRLALPPGWDAGHRAVPR